MARLVHRTLMYHPRFYLIMIEKVDIYALRKSIFTPKRRVASPMECVHAFSRAIDEILRKLFRDTAVAEGYSDMLCLVATGGYGRGEMCPFSDVDLMALYAEGTPLPVIKSFERHAWDLGLNLGYAARTPSECADLLGDDIVTDAALLESTFITGNVDMFTRYIDRTVRPFFRRRRRRFLEAMRESLVDGVFSSADTLYRIEPDVKNGICCLRDCHRIGWAERVAQEVTGGGSRPMYQFISREDHERLNECYAFLMKVRTELHMQSNRRLDILEVGLQHEVAGAFGYKDGAPAGLMSDFFRAVTHIKQCILSFTEKVYLRQPLIKRVRSALASFSTAYGLKIIDGILQPRSFTHIDTSSATWVLGVFSTAITCHAEVGTSLRNLLRQAAQHFTPEMMRNSECEAVFREILAARRHGGRVLQLMHETGILDLLLPEFTPLTCRVEFDTYHEYTVDQHTMLALRSFDGLSNETETTILRAYLRIVNRRVFRLALLLHDSGKALEGDHCRSGAIIARNAAVRLGFETEEQDMVEFLVYHHLDMSDLSLRRETEDTAVRLFAETVGTIELLDMLYVLTVLDIRHVGSKTWTGWKAVQMAEIFTLAEAFVSGKEPPPRRKQIMPDYQIKTLPEDLRTHEQWLEMLGNDAFQMHTETFTGFHRVTIIARDRIALLSDIAACFIAAGLQIIHAQVFSDDEGRVIDIFDVEPEHTTSMKFEERRERFMETWKKLKNKKTTSSQIVHDKMKRSRIKAVRQLTYQPKVTINNSDSERYTIIEVRAPDRFGLLHTLVSTLSRYGVNIHTARIATAVDSAVDVFYVSDAEGKKIDTTLRVEIIRQVVDEAVGSSVKD